MARLAATGEHKARAARQMRATAGLLDSDHPEMMAGDHLRDAARLTEHGSLDGAKRHLDAAMFMLTPQSLMRHGITDDDGHSLAKHHMHQVNRHRLAVMDIEDLSARNERLRTIARAASQPPQQPSQPAAPPGRRPVPPDSIASIAAANGTQAILLSARTAMLEHTPAPRGRPGGPGLYDVKGMGHTNYLQQIVKALIEKRGMDPGKAYAIARGAIRRWMRGGGHVHPEVQAAAGKAEAGELVRQARAKASHGHAISPWEVADTLIELAVIELDWATVNAERSAASATAHQTAHDTASATAKRKFMDARSAQPLHGKQVFGRTAQGNVVKGTFDHPSQTVMPAAGGRIPVTHVAPVPKQPGSSDSGDPTAMPPPIFTSTLAGQPSVVLDFFNPNHGANGQFTTAAGAQQGKGKQSAQQRDRRADAPQRRELTHKIASVRIQLASLESQLRAAISARSGKSKSSTPAKKGAAATSAKAAATAKATATKATSTAKSATSTTTKTPSVASLRSQIIALRATLAADIAQLRHL